MYPGMDTASNYSGGNPKKNSEAHKTSGYIILLNKFVQTKLTCTYFVVLCINLFTDKIIVLPITLENK